MSISTYLKKTYYDLEDYTMFAIRKLIDEQGRESKFNADRVLPVNVSFIDGEMIELKYDNRLSFINNNGYHFDWNAVCTLEDLIELISMYEETKKEK